MLGDILVPNTQGLVSKKPVQPMEDVSSILLQTSSAEIRRRAGWQTAPGCLQEIWCGSGLLAAESA